MARCMSSVIILQEVLRISTRILKLGNLMVNQNLPEDEKKQLKQSILRDLSSESHPIQVQIVPGVDKIVWAVRLTDPLTVVDSVTQV